jgi:ABC-type transporter Mla maintaining outer membrane lipid asymmetry ATPase subunit MlaF
MMMRQRLRVAASLIGIRSCLILDEPMIGLVPAGTHMMRDMIRSLVAEVEPSSSRHTCSMRCSEPVTPSPSTTTATSSAKARQ